MKRNHELLITRGKINTNRDDYYPASSGIGIRWHVGKRTLFISAFYDSYVGIEGCEIPLHELLFHLNVSAKDVKKEVAKLEELYKCQNKSV